VELLRVDFVEAVSGVAAGEAVPDGLVSAAALVDFDFFGLADFEPESASTDAAVSVDEAFADFDFFELVDFAPDAESAEAVESAFADFDFFALVDFVPDAESVDAVESPVDDLADLDFFELAEAVDPLAESLSEGVGLAFFDFDVEDFPEGKASLESVAVASVDVFLDLLVFFAGAVVESLESEACAFTGAPLASPNPNPTEIRNANRYFLSPVMPFLPSSRACLESCWQDLRASARIHFAACYFMPRRLKPQRLVERPLRLEWPREKSIDTRTVRTVRGQDHAPVLIRSAVVRILMLADAQFNLTSRESAGSQASRQGTGSTGGEGPGRGGWEF
jgi:hypothetical protein